MSYSSEVLADSPSAYWRLGEASGGTLVDSSGNSKDGSYNGTITHVTGLVSGDADTCVDFNGTDSCADLPAFTGGADAARISADCLISLDANNKLQIILTRANESGANRKSFRLAVSSTNHAVFEVWIGGTLYTATGSTTLSVGTTYHVAGTFDESDVKVYVNGSLDGSSAAAGSLTLYGIGLGGLLGAGYNGSLYGFFDGKIDEVAFYAAALSSTRVAAHYTAGSTTPNATVTPPAATATAAARVPVVSAASSVAPPAAAATAAALLPTIGAGGNATVSPPAATATATAFAPTVTQVIPVGTDTSNSLNGRRRRARASVVVTRPAAAVPSRAAVKYDKSVPLPPPVLVDGRLT